MKITSSRLRTIIREEIERLDESRMKGYESALRKVYSNLPEFVFNDMYSQEGWWKNAVDPDIGPEAQELAAAVKRNEPGAIERFREFERRQKSLWVDTKWQKRPQVVNLKWHDLAPSKRDFFEKKYTGKLRWFPARDGGHGYLDKIERILPKMMSPESTGKNEPVLLLKTRAEDGYEVIGGNNRTFNAFLARAIAGLKREFSDDMFSGDESPVFKYLNEEDPEIKINAYVGEEI